MIHVCYGLYDRDGRYSKFCGTSITSIFENTTQAVTIHLLHDNTLTADNRDKFNYLAGHYGQKIKFYNVDVLVAEEIEAFKKIVPQVLEHRVTIGGSYRLFIPKIISEEVDKIIYFDNDVLINLDIINLWKIEIENYPIAAVSEIEMQPLFKFTHNISNYLIRSKFVKMEDYFNSGVLLLNLNYLRNNYDILINGCKFRGTHPECGYLDQDILNYCFANNYLKLSTKFNSFNAEVSDQEAPKVKKVIYHFANNTVNFDLKNIFFNLYFKYFAKTPWFNFETLANLSSIFYKFYENRQTQLIHMINLLGRKRRAFFAEKNHFDILKNIFAITEDEEFINSNVPLTEGMNNLINAMKVSRDKKVFFIVINDPGMYGIIRHILIQNNLIENVDFINAMTFLPEQYFNTNFIVKEM
ncbi:MAG: hypothetical protein IJ728_00555 [Selenomonadaceae bacterium]|nr:hypothetical protein [Selenomonadaceae bacterium]